MVQGVEDMVGVVENIDRTQRGYVRGQGDLEDMRDFVRGVLYNIWPSQRGEANR